MKEVEEAPRWGLGLIIVILAMSCMASNSAQALPPEGYEAYGIWDSGRTRGDLFYLGGGYNNPSWSSDYEFFSVINSINTGDDDYFTMGAQTTVRNQFSDRVAYFGRYDFTFIGQSLSFKLNHIDYRYIRAAKNIVSLDYNGAFGGDTWRIYITAGMYYRFSLYRWNNPTWSPANFNTNDREYYFEGVIGLKNLIGRRSSWTLDLNTRDAFNSYNGDNIAADFALNLASEGAVTVRFYNSLRFTGLLGLTADMGEEQVGMNIIYEH